MIVSPAVAVVPPWELHYYSHHYYYYYNCYCDCCHNYYYHSLTCWMRYVVHILYTVYWSYDLHLYVHIRYHHLDIAVSVHPIQSRIVGHVQYTIVNPLARIHVHACLPYILHNICRCCLLFLLCCFGRERQKNMCEYW